MKTAAIVFILFNIVLGLGVFCGIFPFVWTLMAISHLWDLSWTPPDSRTLMAIAWLAFVWGSFWVIVARVFREWLETPNTNGG